MLTERLLISPLLLRAKNGSNIFNHLVHNVAFVLFFLSGTSDSSGTSVVRSVKVT